MGLLPPTPSKAIVWEWGQTVDLDEKSLSKTIFFSFQFVKVSGVRKQGSDQINLEVTYKPVELVNWDHLLREPGYVEMNWSMWVLHTIVQIFQHLCSLHKRHNSRLTLDNGLCHSLINDGNLFYFLRLPGNLAHNSGITVDFVLRLKLNQGESSKRTNNVILTKKKMYGLKKNFE